MPGVSRTSAVRRVTRRMRRVSIFDARRMVVLHFWGPTHSECPVHQVAMLDNACTEPQQLGMLRCDDTSAAARLRAQRELCIFRSETPDSGAAASCGRCERECSEAAGYILCEWLIATRFSYRWAHDLQPRQFVSLRHSKSQVDDEDEWKPAAWRSAVRPPSRSALSLPAWGNRGKPLGKNRWKRDSRRIFL